MAEEKNKTAKRQTLAHGRKNNFKSQSYSIYCGHNDREVISPSEFEVVPEWKRGNDRVTIEAMDGRPFALAVRDDAARSTILLSGSGKSKLSKYTFECEFSAPEGEALFKKFWKSLSEPRKYEVEIEDRRGKKNLEIKAYCPDQYTFQIKFPELAKFSRGSKLGINPGDAKQYLENKPVQTKVSHEYTEQKWNPHAGLSYSRTRSRTEDARNNRSKTVYKNEALHEKTPSGPLVLTRNGVSVEVNALKILGSTLQLADHIYNIYKKITDDIPQVGWYFDMNLQLLQGTFELSWGWQEYEDHRAFLWMGLGIDCKIIEVAVELGIGATGFGCKLQVFGKVEGSLSLKILAARTSPDMISAISLPLDGAIEGNVGARFEVKYFVSVEAVITTAIKFEKAQAEFSVEKGVSFDAEIWWTGIKAKIKASAGVAAGAEEEFGKATLSSESVKTLVDKTKLGEWAWPKEEFQPTQELSPRQIREVLKRNFEKDWNIRVEERGSFWDSAWSMGDIVAKIEAKITRRKNLRRDEKSIDLLAWHIRQALKKKSGRDDWHDVLDTIDSNDFVWFLERGSFDRILDQYIDPVKKVLGDVTPRNSSNAK